MRVVRNYQRRFLLKTSSLPPLQHHTTPPTTTNAAHSKSKIPSYPPANTNKSPTQVRICMPLLWEQCTGW
jgi:hypothetical protein